MGKRGLCRTVGAAHPLSGSSRGSGRDERGTHDLRKAIPGSRLRQPGVRERSPAPGKPRKEGWKGPPAPSGQAAEATATFIRPGQLPLAGENKTDVQRHPREMGRTIRGRTQKRGHDCPKRATRRLAPCPAPTVSSRVLLPQGEQLWSRWAGCPTCCRTQEPPALRPDLDWEGEKSPPGERGWQLVGRSESQAEPLGAAAGHEEGPREGTRPWAVSDGPGCWHPLCAYLWGRLSSPLCVHHDQ